MTGDLEPRQPNPEIDYRVLSIGSFDPALFDRDLEEIGEVVEKDLGDKYVRDIGAKFVIVGDSLVLFHPDKFHSSVYGTLQASDGSLQGEPLDAGTVSASQIRQESGLYETTYRRFSERSETLLHRGLMDDDRSWEYRTQTLPQLLADDFYWGK